MKIQLLTYISLSFILLTSFNVDKLSDWKLERNKNGIKVYSYVPPGETLKHIKMFTTVNTNLSSLVSVLTDVTHYTDWIYNCSEARIVEQINQQELIYYSISDVPWPILNRDIVLHNKIHQHKKSLEVYSITTPVDNKVSKKKGFVRITAIKSQWTFTPLKNGYVLIEYYLKIHPGGKVPPWVNNMFISYGPYQSMLNFKEALKLERHKNAKFSFIKNKQREKKDL